MKICTGGNQFFEKFQLVQFRTPNQSWRSFTSKSTPFVRNNQSFCHSLWNALFRLTSYVNTSLRIVSDLLYGSSIVTSCLTRRSNKSIVSNSIDKVVSKSNLSESKSCADGLPYSCSRLHIRFLPLLGLQLWRNINVTAVKMQSSLWTPSGPYMEEVNFSVKAEVSVIIRKESIEG